MELPTVAIIVAVTIVAVLLCMLLPSALVRNKTPRNMPVAPISGAKEIANGGKKTPQPGAVQRNPLPPHMTLRAFEEAHPNQVMSMKDAVALSKRVPALFAVLVPLSARSRSEASRALKPSCGLDAES